MFVKKFDLKVRRDVVFFMVSILIDKIIEN